LIPFNTIAFLKADGDSWKVSIQILFTNPFASTDVPKDESAFITQAYACLKWLLPVDNLAEKFKFLGTNSHTDVSKMNAVDAPRHFLSQKIT